MTPVYLGLGSNLADPFAQLQQALFSLAHLPHSRLLAVSSLYQSAPVGPAGQPDYLNAAALLETDLAPLALLDAIQAIEQAQGRVRKERWGPRTLDIDILLFGSQTLCSERLTIPHPYLTARNFVLYPLAEITPELALPDGQLLQDLVKLCPPTGLRRLPTTLRIA